jgi:aminopeptidase-like protein
MLWVLALADGAHALLDVAERSGLRFAQLRRAAELLHAHALLEPCTPRTKGEEIACASC